MKNVRFVLIVLSVMLLCSFAASDLQAKQKWEKPAKVELQNCSFVVLDYLASAEDAMAELHPGYTLGPQLPFLPDGTVAVLVQIFQCENFRIGEEFDAGGGTIFREIMLGGVISPEGEYLHWVFPSAMTNPLAREALQRVGMRMVPARDLWVDVEIDLDQGTAVGAAFMDNLKPFGPDLFTSCEGSIEPVNTWFGGDAGIVPEYCAFGSGVRGVNWTIAEDGVFYVVEGDPFIEIEGSFTLPVLEMQVFPFFGGMAQVMTGADMTVEAME